MGDIWLAVVAGAVGAVASIPLATIATRVVVGSRRVTGGVRAAMAVAGAAAFALVAVTFGFTWQLPAYLFLAGAAVVLGFVDFLERRLPNRVLYPSLLALPVLLAVASVATGAWSSLLTAVVGGVALFALYFVLAVISPAGIGMGDVKLAALIGMSLGFLGWTPTLVGATAGFLIGGVTSLVALLSGRAGLKTALPFGPAMLAGAFIGILVS